MKRLLTYTSCWVLRSVCCRRLYCFGKCLVDLVTAWTSATSWTWGSRAHQILQFILLGRFVLVNLDRLLFLTTRRWCREGFMQWMRYRSKQCQKLKRCRTFELYPRARGSIQLKRFIKLLQLPCKVRKKLNGWPLFSGSPISCLLLR